MVYVAGFLFSPDKSKVLLIQKLKPDWQKGRLNGVGGKLEEEETYLGAMIREFEEETGASVSPWECFASLQIDEGWVYFFRAFDSDDRRGDIESKTDESVAWYPVAKLDKLPVIPNLRWLIPLALDSTTRFVSAEEAA